MAFPEVRLEIFRSARPPRRNHRNLNRIGYGACQFAVEARSGTVSIHGSQQNLARTIRFRLACPFQSMAARRTPAAMREDLPGSAILSTLRVNRDDHCLRAKALRDSRDQLRIGKRRSVDADLVCTRGKDGCGLFESTNATADREWNEKLSGGSSYRL